MDLYEKIEYVCSKFEKSCNGCPFHETSDVYACFLCGAPTAWPDKSEIEPIIDKWLGDHPSRTRQDKFLEHYPKAEKNPDGFISICPRQVDNSYAYCDINCYFCKEKYWLQEVE